MNVLITGTSGFIGFHLALKIINCGYNVVGIDNINEYYDIQLKLDRLTECGIDTKNLKYNVPLNSVKYNNYKFIKLDIIDNKLLSKVFENNKFDLVIHLAAQAGVRYSLENPKIYISSNIDGFLNILENCKANGVKRLIYASSSSVYGLSPKQQLSVNDNTDNPVSLYAATKKANELMAQVYSHLYNIETIGLRFFTVYGPWGRPDMAPFLFTKSILSNNYINLFNHGNMSRDFTYIDDIINAIIKLTTVNIPEKRMILNIGNNTPIKLLEFINCLESELSIKANINLIEMQPGDVISTWADTKELNSLINYTPITTINEGIHHFIQWYRNYYKI